MVLPTFRVGDGTGNVDPIRVPVVGPPNGDDDGDGIINACDPDQTGGLDCDLNGEDDACQNDADLDGLIDACDPDLDGDSIPNACDVDQTLGADCDQDGQDDSCQLDTDQDGLIAPATRTLTVIPSPMNATSTRHREQTVTSTASSIFASSIRISTESSTPVIQISMGTESPMSVTPINQREPIVT